MPQLRAVKKKVQSTTASKAKQELRDNKEKLLLGKVRFFLSALFRARFTLSCAELKHRTATQAFAARNEKLEKDRASSVAAHQMVQFLAE